MGAWPQVTFFRGGTEAPDETAQGPWLALAAKAGFSYLMANVGYLRDGQPVITRIEEDGQRDSVTRTTHPGAAAHDAEAIGRRADDEPVTRTRG